MDYHGRIMNIEVDVASMAAAGKPRSLRFAFKAGHRDARHAAAEIALEAQAEIARLRAELARVAEPARVIAAHAADAMAAKDMVIGALLDTLRQWQYAENNDDRDELANARTNRDEALAQVAEVGK